MAKRANSRVKNDAVRTEALDLVLNEIKASPSGEVTTSAQRLGARVGRAGQTAGGWISAWEKAGLIAVDRLSGNRGVRVLLPKSGARAEALVLPFPVSGEEASQETPDNAASEVNSEAPTDTAEGSTTSGAKPARKRRSTVRRVAKPDVVIPVQPASGAQTPGRPLTVPATPAAHVPVLPVLSHPAAPPESVFSGSFLVWIVKAFSFAAVAISVAAVGHHVAGTEESDPFAYWLLVSVSVLISLSKPVFGSVSERLFAQRNWGGAIVASIIALAALSYDASQLLSWRGGGMEDKAATTQASIDSRKRNQGRLDDLIAERKRLVEEDRPRPAGVIAAELTRTQAENRCKPVKVSRKSNETTIPAACTRAIADLESEKAKAERVEALAGLIEEATTKFEARPVQAGADGGAKAAAASLNWVSETVAGVQVATAQGMTNAWGILFVLIVEIVAVLGFALASMMERSEERYEAKKGA